ncbi:MAG: hypothetical protein V2A62_00260 [Candidatus Woesearchaeota archaeon]
MKIKWNVGALNRGWEKARLPILILGAALYLITSIGEIVRENRYSGVVQRVMDKAKGNDEVFNVEEARELAEAIGYERPISDTNGRLFRLYTCTHHLCMPAGIFGGLSVDEKRYFLNEQKLEDYLRSN